ncbi:MAG TPA: chemotaxis-specific protein-glutamate methyltransferase CheB [Leptospiraceae bacterium]|nr:chemotaxis-specific protein-glutamate methyltransferase CheB [Leptospiraceae bacterium]HMW06908.1 chemotaxis-specific protein-glutamate methyltransferase CheB [Leptospiraceae bacterium]HMX32270.1 chemotaxis-specific protein-glutamate methyltransferase CheB [Leptospiraceae bacterium]HMY33438.1 chemotaxis-specific protein-glutamate methyltransferase CheB [Leptospiraceae bacterium]HMZ65472.1 chemotaxis-specific protein-glutamate methyltransferase CheB [Leptospiraceae bacterium]
MSEQKKITVIIVDDSDIYRTLVFKILSQSSEIEVISLARSGQLALPRVRHYKPDIVILDMEMPDLDGLKTLEIIRKDSPDTKVIMFCSKTPESAKQTIRALELGASDFVTKPEATSGESVDAYIEERLVAKIKAIGRYKPVKAPIPKQETVIPKAKPILNLKGEYDVCAIGISTGGPDALRLLLPNIPKNLDGSIFIVQHMPPFFTKQLAESLNSITELTVVEGADGMKIQKGYVYIAPGGKHMIVRKASGLELCIGVIDSPPEENCKPAVNVLFRSVAELYGRYAVGVIMTGMGQDGYKGFLEMKKVGAYLMAQDEASSLVFGMPSLPIKEKLVSEVKNIKGLSDSIIRLLGTV